MSKKKPGIRQLSKEAWRLMSKWVRLRDKGICFTCGKKIDPSKKGAYHAGHFKHAPKTSRVSYDPRNVNGQCTGCNTWGNGKLDVYATRLVALYGPDVLQELERLKKTAPKMTALDYDNIIADLKGKIGGLKEDACI